jgi:hypothetical protein
MAKELQHIIIIIIIIIIISLFACKYPKFYRNYFVAVECCQRNYPSISANHIVEWKLEKVLPGGKYPWFYSFTCFAVGSVSFQNLHARKHVT